MTNESWPRPTLTCHQDQCPASSVGSSYHCTRYSHLELQAQIVTRAGRSSFSRGARQTHHSELLRNATELQNSAGGLEALASADRARRQTSGFARSPCAH